MKKALIALAVLGLTGGAAVASLVDPLPGTRIDELAASSAGPRGASGTASGGVLAVADAIAAWATGATGQATRAEAMPRAASAATGSIPRWPLRKCRSWST